MGIRKFKRNEIKIGRESVLNEKDMKQIVGSGNSQVRFIPDEYLQAKILKEGVMK